MTDDASRTWRVKYDGVCSKCGTPLLRGAPAVWDKATRSIHCIECPAARRTPAPISGVAGASARSEHLRRKAKRDAAIDERFGQRFGRVVRAVTSEPQSTRAWAIGASGEEKLAAALAHIPGLKALHDRRVPQTRGNIDHLVIAPAGVFVVDAKHYKGSIEIRNRGWLLRPDHRLYVGGRDCSKLAHDMSWQVEAVEAALRTAGVDPKPAITPVLCFIDGTWPLLARPDAYAGVRLESERSLEQLVTKPGDLDIDQIDRLTTILAGALPSK
jgi:Nuclease-related domain.